MKLVLDERVKHRLIGLAVILSIAAIFAPAIVKKSNQRFEGNVSVSVELPPKPVPPKVVMPDEKAMFAAAKVAQVEIPVIPNKQAVIKVARAEQLSIINDEVKPSVIAQASIEDSKSSEPIAETIIPRIGAKKLEKNQPAQAAQKTVKAAPTLAKNTTNARYAVQLATFSQQHNADSLVSKLRAKGYQATYKKTTFKGGVVYKVIVGRTDKKEQALDLQKQLASVMQLNGFIITEVS